ncbi:hypothetical protein [Levilactobacillus fuyuanensis]|uniref:Uncharacterized protein n=1 Tax=Levilactobacillus fuyuanensis TaxID=2486022 RepID=A0ABW4H324_9LACO|nr:hypothetical protein [Levilactobacillus fuyuanensis]
MKVKITTTHITDNGTTSDYKILNIEDMSDLFEEVDKLQKEQGVDDVDWEILDIQ